MAAVKWIVVALFSLAGLGALAMGVVEGGAPRQPVLTSAPAISLRTYPALGGALTAAPGVPEVAKTPEPVAAKTPEPVAAKTPEPVAAKTPEPVAAKTPPPTTPAPTTPAPVAAAPVAKAPPVPVAEGMINLRATDTADVYLDGKKLGGSPLLGVKSKVGNHKVRFDCYDAAGNTVAGPVQTVAVKAEAEVDIEYTCPTE